MKERYVFLLNSSVRETEAGVYTSSYLGAGEASEIPGALLLRDRVGGTCRIPTGARKGPPVFTYTYRQEYLDGTTHEGRGVIGDTILVKRIVEYFDRYHGRVPTNCVTFAEYLKTGMFQPLDTSKNGFQVTGTMHAYGGQKIEVGDTIFLMMFNKHPTKRSMPAWIQRHYKKRAKAGGDWGNIGLRKKSLTDKELFAEYMHGVYGDFHAMTCIGTIDGELLFIEQSGCDRPDVHPHTKQPIVITRGTVRLRVGRPIAWAFIQKRRNRKK